MPNVKTAISLEKSIYDQMNELAQELKLSRSRLFALAAEEFIKRRKNKRLLDEINSAYDDSPDSEEQEIMRRMHHSAQKVLDEW